MAGGRNAAIGDVLCSLLDAAGYKVTREYYVNDALNSVQMNNFGKSVFVRYRELLGHPMPGPAPEWFYGGEYITDVARNVEAMYGTAYENADIDDQETINAFREMSESGMIAQQKADLEAFGVTFDVWFHESTLHNDGRVQAAIDELTARGATPTKRAARSGCAPRSSATTRTASSAGRTGRQLTSPATPPTTRTSWSGPTKR